MILTAILCLSLAQSIPLQGHDGPEQSKAVTQTHPRQTEKKQPKIIELGGGISNGGIASDFEVDAPNQKAFFLNGSFSSRTPNFHGEAQGQFGFYSWRYRSFKGLAVNKFFNAGKVRTDFGVDYRNSSLRERLSSYETSEVIGWTQKQTISLVFGAGMGNHNDNNFRFQLLGGGYSLTHGLDIYNAGILINPPDPDRDNERIINSNFKAALGFGASTFLKPIDKITLSAVVRHLKTQDNRSNVVPRYSTTVESDLKYYLFKHLGISLSGTYTDERWKEDITQRTSAGVNILTKF